VRALYRTLRIGLHSKVDVRFYHHEQFAALLQRTTMEDLFAPTTRLHDLYHARERDDDDDDDSDDEEEEEEEMDALVELELVTGSSVEETFLH
jgi:hypothetical protein